MSTSGNVLIDAATGKALASQIDLSTCLLGANDLSDLASPSTALTNLGAAASGANSDITSLLALDSPYEHMLGFVQVSNATATGNSNLYTCPADKVALVTRAFVIATTLTGFSVTGICNIGVSSEDIIPATTLTNLITAGLYTNIETTTARQMVATEVAVFRLTTAFTATTAALAVVLMGIKVPA